MGRHMDRRRFLVGIGLFTAGGAAGAGLTAEPGLATEAPTARTAAPSGPGSYRATVLFRASPSARLVALTIDDGPTSEWTPQVLAILRRHGAKATFFRVGRRAQAAPDLVRQTADAGHEQGNHTWAHDDLTQHGAAFARGSLERTHQLLAELTGRAPTLCRPPYGRIDSVGLAVCAGLRYGVTLWSQHVTGGRPHGDVNTFLQQGSPGSIVLAHDGGREPNVSLMTELDRMVASMTDRGYRFVTVSELLSSPGQEGVNHPRLHHQFRLVLRLNGSGRASRRSRNTRRVKPYAIRFPSRNARHTALSAPGGCRSTSGCSCRYRSSLRTCSGGPGGTSCTGLVSPSGTRSAQAGDHIGEPGVLAPERGQ